MKEISLKSEKTDLVDSECSKILQNKDTLPTVKDTSTGPKEVLFIFGPAAVGKTVVGREIAKRLGYTLFDDRIAIEPVLATYGKINWPVVNEVRDVFLRQFAQSDMTGLILTMTMHYDLPSDWDYLNHLMLYFPQSRMSCLELTAKEDTLIHRAGLSSLVKCKSFQQDTKEVVCRVREDNRVHRCLSKEGELPFKRHFILDAGILDPWCIAKRATEELGLYK